MSEHKAARYTFTEYLSRQLNLPAEVVSGAVMINMVGAKDLTIENYTSMIEYDEKLIRIQARRQKITVRGRCLSIRSYTYDSMTINGIIESVSFETGQEARND